MKDGKPLKKWVWMEEPGRHDHCSSFEKGDTTGGRADAAPNCVQCRRYRTCDKPQRRYVPCHAVVIENLTNYRPEETRTRRENRQLMSWSASKVKKFLSEACQLHGLHLREVAAGYTSRQDSRTGAPGVRCADIPVDEFLTAPWWHRQINIARKKADDGKGDAREKLLLELEKVGDKIPRKKSDDCSNSESCPHREACRKTPEEKWKCLRTFRIPLKGGEIFVSADPGSPAAQGLQADLNAAANIALKALLDPDWPGKWWYIPCSGKDGKPLDDKVKGAACIDPAQSLCLPPSQSAGKRGGKGPKEFVNAWRDPSALMDGAWQPTAAYWQAVQSRVIEVLRAANGLKPIEKAIDPSDTPW